MKKVNPQDLQNALNKVDWDALHKRVMKRISKEYPNGGIITKRCECGGTIGLTGSGVCVKVCEQCGKVYYEPRY